MRARDGKEDVTFLEALGSRKVTRDAPGRALSAREEA